MKTGYASAGNADVLPPWEPVNDYTLIANLGEPSKTPITIVGYVAYSDK
jgi:hypothetical protein